MKKMLIVSLFAIVSAPLFAAGADKCGCNAKPRPGRPARSTPTTDAERCGCNANKPKGTAGTTKGCGSCCNSCNGCNNKPCCGR